MAPEREKSWLRRHRSALGLSLRSTLAALLAFAAAELLGLRQVYWAVLTAVIVMQSSVGGSVKATLDRLLGTLAGAAWGLVVALALPGSGTVALGVALAATVAPLATLAAFAPSYRVAPITGIIVLISSANQPAAPWMAALERVLNIGLGSIAALAVALFVLPARAHHLVAEVAGGALTLMAEQIEALLADLGTGADPVASRQRQDRIRQAVSRAETAAEEAAQERASRLTEAPDPGPLVRALRRLTYDLSMVSRATVEPIPGPVVAELAPPDSRAGTELARFFRAAGAALTDGAPPPSLDCVEQALDDYARAMDDLRRQGLTRELPSDSVERIFALGFALEQLRRDTAELADRMRAGAADDKTPGLSRPAE